MEHFKNITIGPKYAVRLGDLGRWHRLQAVCLSCRHSVLLEPEKLKRRFPSHTRVVELEAKLRCRKCGNRGGNSLKVGRLGRD